MAKTNKKNAVTAPATGTVDSGARRGAHMDGTAAGGKGKRKSSGAAAKKGAGGAGGRGRKSAAEKGTGKAKSSGASEASAPPSNLPEPCKGGDPINVLTGEVIDTQEDLILPGVKPWVFRREYSSGWASERLPFGRGWTHPYHQYITVLGDLYVLRGEDGRSVTLGALDEGTKTIHRGLRLEIRRTGALLELESLEDGTTRYFEPLTRGGPAWLRRVVAQNGRSTVLSYNGGRLAGIVTPAKSIVRITYGDGPEITRLAEVSEDGRELRACRYEYTGNGELSRMVDAAGVEYRWSYDDHSRLSRAFLPTGAVIRWEYDEEGRCRESFGNGKLHHWRFQRDPNSGEVVVTGVEQARVFVFGGQGQLLEERGFDGKPIHQYEYDPDLLLIAESNAAGETTRYQRDEHGAVIAKCDPAGNWTGYLRSSRRLIVAHPNGTRTTHTYDGRGFLVRTVFPDGSERRHERDQYGREVAVYGTDGLIEHRDFNERDQITWKRDANGLETNYRYDDRGLLMESTDSLGRVTRFEYDAYGRLLREIAPDGSSTHRQYDAYGHVTLERDALGRETQSEYRGTGELAQVRHPDGRVWQYARDTNERLIRITNPLGEETQYERDLLGRKTAETSFDGRRTEHRYDLGDRELRRDRPDGTFREWSYDPLGNITRESSTHGERVYERFQTGDLYRAVADEGAEQFTVEYDRDELGRIVWEKQGEHELRWEYDPAGRVSARVVCGERTEYEYNPAGKLTAVTHEGKRISISRDAAGREVQRSTAGGRVVIESHWDARDRLTDRRVITPELEDGLPPLAVPGKALIADTFGDTGKRAASHRRFHWDTVGRLTGVEDRTWGATQYAYDDADRLTEATRGRSTELFVNDAAGSVVAVKRMFDGVERLQKYGADSLGASTGLPYPEPAVAQWGGAGDPLRPPPPPLLPSTPASLMALGSPARLDGKPGNILTEYGRYTYENDAAGRRTLRRDRKTGEETRYIWDCRDQLREVRLPDGARVRHFYDAFGRRVRKDYEPPRKNAEEIRAALERELLGGAAAPETRGYSVTYLWDDDELCAEIWSDGRRRVHVHERGSFVPLLQSEGGAVYPVVTDHLGTPKELVDEEGRVVWSVAHGAWGNATESWKSGRGAESPFRLLGQLWEPETGLCWTRFRVFENSTARWLSPDPLGLDGGDNGFGFDGSPTTEVDPVGLDTKGKQDSDALERAKTPEQGAQPKKPAANEDDGPESARAPKAESLGITKALAPFMGSFKFPNSDAVFKARVIQDLNTIASTKQGRRTLKKLRRSGKNVELCPPHHNAVTASKFEYAKDYSVPNNADKATRQREDDDGRPPDKTGPFDHDSQLPAWGRVRHGARGEGSDSTVVYDPNRWPRPPEDEHGGQETPSDAVLYHELVHCEHNAWGDNRNGFIERDDTGVWEEKWKNYEEKRTLEDENAYRRERGLDERSDYVKPMP